MQGASHQPLTTSPWLLSPSPLIQVVEFILRDPLLKHLPKEQVCKALDDVGFTPEMQERGLTKISGGWKMKLALARAMLLNADILLLDGENDEGEGGRGEGAGKGRGQDFGRLEDEAGAGESDAAERIPSFTGCAAVCTEPTNHLDTTNVAWLVNYLVNIIQRHVTHAPNVTPFLVLCRAHQSPGHNQRRMAGQLPGQSAQHHQHDCVA